MVDNGMVNEGGNWMMFGSRMDEGGLNRTAVGHTNVFSEWGYTGRGACRNADDGYDLAEFPNLPYASSVMRNVGPSELERCHRRSEQRKYYDRYRFKAKEESSGQLKYF